MSSLCNIFITYYCYVQKYFLHDRLMLDYCNNAKAHISMKLYTHVTVDEYLHNIYAATAQYTSLCQLVPLLLGRCYVARDSPFIFLLFFCLRDFIT